MLYDLVEEAYTFTVAMQRWSATLLAELDLTEPLADVLWHLDPANARVSMRHLASLLHCDPSNVTFLADRLEQRGLVQRHTNPSDRRVKLIALTPAGARLRSHLLRDATKSPLSRLSQEDQRRLRDLLAKTRSAAESASPRTRSKG